ncbi:MAG: hypothetical protein ABIH46_02500 [Chloroflexota bacterium]
MEVVKKKWGEEIIICNNDLYAAKILAVERGAISSLHRHLRKDETFWCIGGGVSIEVEGRRTVLTGRFAPLFDEPLRVRPGQWHRFEAIHLGGNGSKSWLLEISTPHSDDDVERQTESQSAEERRCIS